MVKKLFILFALYLGLCGYTFGASAPCPTSLEKINDMFPSMKTTLPPAVTPPSPTTPQPVDFNVCCKSFNFNSQKLFYLTLAGINANRFKIDEIQTQSGYVIFTAAQKQFLAYVVTMSPQTSLLKITPCSNIYFFPVGIVQNMFKYIELNTNTPIEKINVL